MQESGFWSDQNQARAKSERYNYLKNKIDFWTKLQKNTEELYTLTAEHVKAGDESSREFLNEEYEKLKNEYEHARIQAFFTGKYDSCNAILSVHAGAGGSDAQDWAEMLVRMYLRYAEKKGFTAEVLDKSKGAEVGIKSAILEIKGFNAYGYLKSEAGVHRLVRLSEFNPAHTRETSFALVEVLPVLHEQNAIKIDPKEIKIETSTASGHGGQSVNTTYSAVRIIHIPTGIRVSIQNERSQSQNKEKAMEILISRLQALEEQRRQKEKQEIRGEFHSPQWGNQIRSYVLHPYKLVKDHRTGLESSEPDKILGGDLDDFVEKFLEKRISG